MPTFENIEACVFDAYGTLFDVHSAVGKHRMRLGSKADQVSSLWRTKQLEYTWLRSLMKRHTDFWQVTRDGLEYALDTFGIANDSLKNDLLNAYLALDCYPEVPDTLARLKSGGLRTAILSNGAPNMLQAAVDNTKLTGLIDAILSIEEIGIYKPDPQVYQLAVDRLGTAPKAISFQSSNAWDAAGAASFGFRVAWINRFAQRPERLPFTPDVELNTLNELPDVVGV